MQKQMDPSGEFPLEVARTDSLGYSCMNLNGFAQICEIAHFAGVDLWNRDCGGVSMSTAIRCHAPYIAQPETWPHESIHKKGDAPLAMLGASLRLQDEEVRALAAEALRARGEDPLRSISPFGPVVFWFER